MIPACHSLSTLKEMLREAAARVAHSPQTLARRIDELRRSIDEEGFVSASVEHEIVSLFVLAELKGTPMPPSSSAHSA